MSSLVWHRSVRGAGVLLPEDDAAGWDVEAVPGAGVLADDVPAEIPLVEPVEPDAACEEVVAAVTDPENEQAESARTARTAAGSGRAARGSEIVMPPR